jgi:hypothetical protein
MAVAARTNGQAAVYFGAVATKTLTRPAGIAAGDLLVAICGSNSSVTWTVPSGFQKLGPTVSESSGYRLQVFWKIATAAEPGSYTFTSSATTYGGVSLMAYTGAAAAAPFSRFAFQANPTLSEIDFPSVDAPTAGGALLLAATINSGIVPTVPAGFTDRSVGVREFTYEKMLPASGATGAVAAVFSGTSTSIALALHITPTVVAPVNVTQPTLSGSPWSGGSLGAVPGDWLGPDSYGYVWKRDGVTI